jgi:hypothetical protein
MNGSNLPDARKRRAGTSQIHHNWPAMRSRFLRRLRQTKGHQGVVDE